jgi:twin BRCT domain
MAGLRVCASGFSTPQREDLARKVEYMGGVFDKDLHQEVINNNLKK